MVTRAYSIIRVVVEYIRSNILIKQGVSMEKKNSVTVRFVKPVIKQTIPETNISRLVGFIDPLSFIRLYKAGGMEANPRAPKETQITKAIMETIMEQPDLFPFKTKGVLFGASKCVELERERYEVFFDGDKDRLGILDGGHNTFAIIKYLCGLLDDVDVRFKKKDEMQEFFDAHFCELVPLLQELKSENNPLVSFKIPVEIIMPSSADDPNALQTFFDNLVDICQARNKNQSLKEEALDNKEGIYDFIKDEVLPKEISNKIIWKTNEEGDIPSTDVVAFAWAFLQDFDKSISLTQIYSSKGACVKSFGNLVKKRDGNGKFLYVAQTADAKLKIVDDKLMSALRLMSKFPRIYDNVYKKFPEAYNAAGGSFGRIRGVKKSLNNGKKRVFLTKFYNEPCDYSYPDGFIVPLICGTISALICKDDSGLYVWKRDPIKFLDEHIDDLLKVYKGLIDMANWNPQNVGKNSSTYSTIQAIVPAYL